MAHQVAPTISAEITPSKLDDLRTLLERINGLERRYSEGEDAGPDSSGSIAIAGQGEVSLTTDRNTLRAALREKFPRDHGQLLPALHFLQHEFGHLPDWAMEVVGWHLGIPASEVYGAATSYTELRVEKPGTHVVRVCTGLSCWTNGGKELLSAVESELGAHPGQTTSDGLITFEETPCAFLCGVAPVIEVDGSWRGRAESATVAGLLQEMAHS